MSIDVSTPVLLLGGKENALSVTRHLGRLGVRVAVSGPESCWALWSRYCAEAVPVPKGRKQQEFWSELLLGNSGRFNGHIVLAMSDDAIEFIGANRDRLQSRYILDEADAALQRAFLDKIETLEIARKAGVDTPNFWKVENEEQLAALESEVKFPVMVKPIQSHSFIKAFKAKLFIVESSAEELKAQVRRAWARNIGVFVVEMIPGPDSQLSSYYTYRTRDGRRLFDFTKSVIRRWPVNRGNACYHKTGWLPATAAAGMRFFEHAGLRGLGNIEFKHDTRDGKLKVIEVNARFTAAQELVRRAGLPIDLIIYCQLTRQPLPTAKPVQKELRLWYPLRDFLGFAELWRKGDLSFWGWLRSVTTVAPVLPLVSLSDPLPVYGALSALAHRLMS
jgi:D-aspartate ligase